MRRILRLKNKLQMKNLGNYTKAIMFSVIAMVGLQSTAQKIEMPAPSPLQTVTQKFGLGEVTIEYSRPSVKNRTIFGDIVPYGKMWRTGANASTKITFTQDVEVEGNPVKAGTYAMYTIPDRNTWEVMLYTDLKLGGKVAEYNKENEVLHVIVKPIRIPMKIETLTWNLGNVEPSSAVITMLWENVFLPIKITTKIDDQVMKNIEASMKSDEPDYFRAAGYYFENDKDLKQALEWVNKAVELNPTAYYMMFLKAKIEYKMGDKKAGNASAEKTIALAEEAKNADYVALASKLLEANK